MALSLFLTIAEPIRPDIEGQGKNRVFRVTCNSKVYRLKPFCKMLGLSYESMIRNIAHMSFGEHHEPFAQIVTTMRKRLAAKRARLGPCPHCNGTGKASQPAEPV